MRLNVYLYLKGIFSNTFTAMWNNNHIAMIDKLEKFLLLIIFVQRILWLFIKKHLEPGGTHEARIARAFL